MDAGDGPDACCSGLGPAFGLCAEANTEGGVSGPCDSETEACEIGCDAPDGGNGPGTCSSACVPVAYVCGDQTLTDCTSGASAQAALCCGVATFYRNE